MASVCCSTTTVADAATTGHPRAHQQEQPRYRRYRHDPYASAVRSREEDAASWTPSHLSHHRHHQRTDSSRAQDTYKPFHRADAGQRPALATPTPTGDVRRLIVKHGRRSTSAIRHHRSPATPAPAAAAAAAAASFTHCCRSCATPVLPPMASTASTTGSPLTADPQEGMLSSSVSPYHVPLPSHAVNPEARPQAHLLPGVVSSPLRPRATAVVMTGVAAPHRTSMHHARSMSEATSEASSSSNYDGFCTGPGYLHDHHARMQAFLSPLNLAPGGLPSHKGATCCCSSSGGGGGHFADLAQRDEESEEDLDAVVGVSEDGTLLSRRSVHTDRARLSLNDRDPEYQQQQQQHWQLMRAFSSPIITTPTRNFRTGRRDGRAVAALSSPTRLEPPPPPPPAIVTSAMESAAAAAAVTSHTDARRFSARTRLTIFPAQQRYGSFFLSPDPSATPTGNDEPMEASASEGQVCVSESFTAAPRTTSAASPQGVVTLGAFHVPQALREAAALVMRRTRASTHHEDVSLPHEGCESEGVAAASAPLDDPVDATADSFASTERAFLRDVTSVRWGRENHSRRPSRGTRAFKRPFINEDGDDNDGYHNHEEDDDDNDSLSGRDENACEPCDSHTMTPLRRSTTALPLLFDTEFCPVHRLRSGPGPSSLSFADAISCAAYLSHQFNAENPKDVVAVATPCDDANASTEALDWQMLELLVHYQDRENAKEITAATSSSSSPSSVLEDGDNKDGVTGDWTVSESVLSLPAHDTPAAAMSHPSPCRQDHHRYTVPILSLQLASTQPDRRQRKQWHGRLHGLPLSSSSPLTRTAVSTDRPVRAAAGTSPSTTATTTTRAATTFAAQVTSALTAVCEEREHRRQVAQEHRHALHPLRPLLS